MSDTDLKKKAAYFFVFAGVIALVLILFPFVEEWLYAYMSAKFGILIATDGSVTISSGNAAG